MKNAIIAAVVAALVSSGGTYAAVKINGQAITKHSIPANRLTTKAVKAFSTAATPTARALAVAVNSTLDYETMTGDVATLPTTVTASCPAGDIAIGGGYSTSANVDQAAITQNGSTTDNTGWQVTMGQGSAFNGVAQLTVNVSCEPSA